MCIECDSLYHKNYRKTEKFQSLKNLVYQRQRRALYLKKYGLTVDAYEAQLILQDGKCAICGTLPWANRRLAVDHDHQTGSVRGLLCTPCNAAIGLFKEDANLILVAYEYLKPKPELNCVATEKIVVSEVVN